MQDNESVLFVFPLYCGFSQRNPILISHAWAVFRNPELAFEYISGMGDDHFEFRVAMAKDSKTLRRALMERLADGISDVIFDYRSDANGQQSSGERISISELLKLIATM